MYRKSLFIALAKFNYWFLPKYFRKDLTRLSKFQKVLIAYKYWVTSNAIS
jgi:adenine C2-methylase RlmN of 23S rRNA A2503 and tRNA A37